METFFQHHMSDALGRASTWVLLAITALALTYHIRSKRPSFPVVNNFPWDLTQRKAYAEYMQNSKSLVSLARKRGPIMIKTPSGPRIVVPSSMTSWVASNKDLDHQEMVRRDFFAGYPGFEGNAMIHHDNRILIDTIKRHMSQNGQLIPIIDEHAAKALDELWTLDDQWHGIDWSISTTSLVSRAAASVFVGPELAQDPEWQRMTIAYATNFFSAVFELKRWPSSLRPIVHWFLPGARSCRQLVKDVRKSVEIERTKRRQAKVNGMNAGHLDALTWTEEAARGDDLDQGAVQLGFAVAALHTTSEALRQVLLDICRHPDLTNDLRAEMKEVIGGSDMTMAAVSKLQLLDSVLKESQRLHPPGIVNLEREAMRDTHLPDGQLIRCGTIVGVDGSDMWSSEIYPELDRFEGYRFLKMREAGNGQTAFVSSTQEQCVFGMGKHVCPGRFLAALELKLCLIHILLKYDVRLKDDYQPVSIKNGFYQMVDPGAQVEVRRRKGDNADILLGGESA